MASLSKHSSPARPDRREKIELRTIVASGYLTIEQNALLVEHWRRSSTALWTVKKHTRLAGTVRLQTRQVALPLAEIYRETNF